MPDDEEASVYKPRKKNEALKLMSRARGMAQLENLSSMPRSYLKMLGALVSTGNLSAGEAETWEPIRLTGQSFSLVSELQASERPYLKGTV